MKYTTPYLFVVFILFLLWFSMPFNIYAIIQQEKNDYPEEINTNDTASIDNYATDSLYENGAQATSPSEDTTTLGPIYINDETQIQPKTLGDLRIYKVNSDFDYTEQEIIKEKTKQTYTRGDDLIDWEDVVRFFFDFGLYIIVGTLVLFMFYKLFQNQIAQYLYIEKRPNNISVMDIDKLDNIQGIDFIELIRREIERKDYRTALRLYYLFLLQSLTHNNLIAYAPHKTNHQYYWEISQQDLRKEYNNLTDIYEYAWYGGFQISQSQFESLKNSFDNVLAKLKTK